MAEQEQNRTEQATPFKLEESRKHGDVARSVDFGSFALVAAFLLALLSGGAVIWGHLSEASARLLSQAGSQDPLALLLQVGREWFAVALPFGILGAAVAIASNLIQTGPVFSFRPLKPRFERINPIDGFRRAYGRRLFIEFVKSLLKLALLGGVAYAFFVTAAPRLLTLVGASASRDLHFLAGQGTALLWRLSMALLIIGLADWGLVRLQFGRRMMMSRRELKEEVRRREGDPHIRSRIRELQRENLSKARSLGRVGDSDVLITNPDHVGVALRYVRGEMTAPHVIAKGEGLWVQRMRELARARGIPILERRPLARQLYRYAAIDRPIPYDTYTEVARVYADIGPDRRARDGRYAVVR
jgi:flagellar biosynthetic protein FlhB